MHGVDVCLPWVTIHRSTTMVTLVGFIQYLSTALTRFYETYDRHESYQENWQMRQ